MICIFLLLLIAQAWGLRKPPVRSPFGPGLTLQNYGLPNHQRLSFVCSSPVLGALQSRNFIETICNNETDDILSDDPKPSVYAGFDITASGLHVGHLTLLMMLRLFNKEGHRPVVVIGDATAQVGDPSDKDNERAPLSPNVIDANKEAVNRTLQHFLTFNMSGTDHIKPLVVSNSAWLSKASFLDFLLNYANHVSLATLLRRETVRKRLEDNVHMSLKEFLYSSVQAYDFVELYRRYGVRIQVGGADQTGNIFTGVNLGGRLGLPPFCGITAPLMLTATSAKMSKTSGGVVWLNREKTSPFEYWQFWRNAPDSETARWLRRFTEIPVSEIETMETWRGPRLNEAKKRLADAATALAHGVDELDLIHRKVYELYEGGIAREGSLPRIEVPLRESMNLTDALVGLGFKNSIGAVQRELKQAHVKIDGALAPSPTLSIANCTPNKTSLVLSIGKRWRGLVKFV